MNKKIIAIAIAAAMSAPVMADVKVSGALGGDMTSNNSEYRTAATGEVTTNGETSITFNDNGMSQINFIATEGDSYGKLGLNVGPGSKSKTAVKQQGNGDTVSAAGPVYRDYFIGHKLGGGMKFQFGNMSGALKNMEKDPYIATFLQLRSSPGLTQTSSAYGSSSFVHNLLQFSMKAGPADVTVQYDATKNVNSSTNEGHTAVGVKGKAGPVAYFAGFNNGTSGEKAAKAQSNVKLGGSMKFGAIKATLVYTTSDTGATNGKAAATAIMADMGMGNGLAINAAYGMKDDDVDTKDANWMRIAVSKKLSKKSTVYGGYTSTKVKDKSNTNISGNINFFIRFHPCLLKDRNT